MTRDAANASTARSGLAEDDRPLGSYGVLIGTYSGVAAVFALWLRRSGRPVPDGVRTGDLALVAVATHKGARLLSKDRVTSVVRAPFTRPEEDGAAGEVEEAARGDGFRRAVGELLVCPYCVALWIASGLTGALIVAPRLARGVSFTLTALTISDFLQVAYRKAEDTL
ncbi:MAG: DUF1360 domain-containing protein [Solirubrobacteraceae bacterium]